MIEIKGIKVDALKDDLSLKIEKILNKKVSYNILKRSIDARNKNNIFYVYDVAIDLPYSKYKNCKNVYEYERKEKKFNITGQKKINNNIVIVGSGPAGLFAAYFLSLYGYKPIIIERGKKVEERQIDVETYWKEGILNPNSNVQFGEGGAGTFSDGKLNTLIKDPEHYKELVFNTFVSNGADESILYDYKPHIGTDKLIDIVKNMREKILLNGGKFLYETTLTDIIVENNNIKEIIINDKDKIECTALVLAIGHSARDTFKMLNKRGLILENKPFAVGLRAIHSQKKIDESQYGKKYSNILSPASYKLTYNNDKRGVYSFCMCPGGYVVNASSVPGQIVCNGMSFSKRNSSTANSAIIVTVTENDYGHSLFDGVKFQEQLERKAYEIGKGNLPISLLKDYHNNKISSKLGSIDPNIKGKYSFANLNELFNKEINDSIKDAFIYFDNKLKGFNDPDTILVGIESRSSSPIRILRDNNMESNIKGIYPIGEGAGYAGGITSSAIDGIKIFEKLISKYYN